MKGAVQLLKVKGIAIRLHWSFIFLPAWILVLQALNRAPLSQTLWAMLAVAAIFCCVALHELGHALAAARFGIPTKNILLLPIGGMANIERMPDKGAQEIAISAAGPLVNLAIAAALLPLMGPYIPFWRSTAVIYNVQAGNFIFYLHTINIMLALFNLIPAFPMDGGRILRGFLALRMEYGRATRMAAITGRIIAGVFIAGGLFSFNLILAAIGIFVLIAGAAEEKIYYLRSHIHLFSLNDLAMRDYASLPAGAPEERALELLLHRHDKYFVSTENQAPVGIIVRAAMIRAIAAGRYEAYIKQLKTNSIPTIDENATAAGILEKLIRHSGQVFPVTHNGKLTGLIDLEAITEHLLIHDIRTKRAVDKSLTRLFQ